MGNQTVHDASLAKVDHFETVWNKKSRKKIIVCNSN